MQKKSFVTFGNVAVVPQHVGIGGVTPNGVGIVGVATVIVDQSILGTILGPELVIVRFLLIPALAGVAVPRHILGSTVPRPVLSQRFARSGGNGTHRDQARFDSELRPRRRCARIVFGIIDETPRTVPGTTGIAAERALQSPFVHVRHLGRDIRQRHIR